MKKFFARYSDYIMAGVLIAFLAIGLLSFFTEMSQDLYLIAFG